MIEPKGSAGRDQVSDLRAIERLEFRYARCLDDDQLELWPEMFVPEGCRYQIIPRENLRYDPPLAIMLCESRGMLRDRVRSLREANVFNLHFPRRLIGNIEIVGQSNDAYDVRANFTVYQTTLEGRTELYGIGQYRDQVAWMDGEPRFREKTVILDTFSIPHLLAIPL